MRVLYDVVESREGFIDRFGNTLSSVRVKLIADEIRALHTTPQTLLPAPGPNKFYQLDTIVAYLDYSGGAFTGANALEIRETNGAGTSLFSASADISAAFLNSVADALVENGANVYWAQTTRVLDAPIVAYVPVADPGGATSTSTLTIILTYRIIKVYN